MFTKSSKTFWTNFMVGVPNSKSLSHSSPLPSVDSMMNTTLSAQCQVFGEKDAQAGVILLVKEADDTGSEIGMRTSLRMTHFS